jgi:hypothetical protein
LGGGMGHDALPVRLAPDSPFARQMHSSADTDHRHNVPDTQFNRLLQRKIHAFSTRDALQQGDVERRLPERRHRIACQSDLSILTPQACDLSQALAALAVEQDHLGAYRQPQHAAQVMHRFAGKGDKRSRFQDRRHPQARNPHG